MSLLTITAWWGGAGAVRAGETRTGTASATGATSWSTTVSACARTVGKPRSASAASASRSWPVAG